MLSIVLVSATPMLTLCHVHLSTKILNLILDIAELQRRDADLAPYFAFIEHNEVPENDAAARRIAAVSQTMILEDGILYNIWWPDYLSHLELKFLSIATML